MKLKELEELRWATEPSQSYGTGKRDLEDPSLILIWANINDIFNHTSQWQRLPIGDPSGGETGKARRISCAQEHWTSGGYMNPSLIHVVNGKYLEFTDGRHRLIAADLMGHTYALVLTDKSTIEQFKEMVKTRPFQR